MLLNRSILRTSIGLTRSIRSIGLTRSYATTTSKPKSQYTIPTVENNKSTESNRLSKTLTKFWNQVNIYENSCEEKYDIQLDNKTVRTPLGYDLSIPFERKLLAYMLYHEWSNISTSTIKTHSLPLTSLISRVIDLENSDRNNDLESMAKVGFKKDIVEDLLKYLDTDTLLIFNPQNEYEGKLRNSQESLYRPIISKFEKKFNNIKLNWLDTEIGLKGNSQSEKTHNIVRSYMLNLNYYDLVALEKITLTTKSLICGIMVLENNNIKNESIIELEEIAKCATLEVFYQTEKWGEVEDTHDVDYQDIRRNITSAAILAFQEEK